MFSTMFLGSTAINMGATPFSQDLDNILFVGASITNQSNSSYVTDMVKPYIENKYGRTINLFNEAVSGTDVADWRASIDSVLDSYVGTPNLGIYLHIGGGDIDPNANFLDYGQSTQQQKIDDLIYIHQAAKDRGMFMVQSSLTFRDYFGTTIRNTIAEQAASSNGSYSYTRDWIVPVMQGMTPEFLDSSGWPLIDMHGMTRNIYKEWREPGSSDYVHPNKLGRLAYLTYAVDCMVAIFAGESVPTMVNRDYNQSVQAPVDNTDIVFGYTRNIYVTDPVKDNINWTVRARPPAAGTEPIYIGGAIDSDGNTLDGVNMYSYADLATRYGDGNISDPTNSTATLSNNDMLLGSLGCDTGSGAMYVLVEGLEANKEYDFDIVTIQETGSATDYNCDIEIADGTNATFNIQPTLTPPENQIVTTKIKSNHSGQVLVASVELHNNNRSTISGIRIYS